MHGKVSTERQILWFFLTTGERKTQPDVTDEDDRSDNLLTSRMTGHMLISTEFPALYTGSS